MELLFGMIERLDRRLRKVEAENGRLRQRLGKYELEVLSGDNSQGDSKDEAGQAVDPLDYRLEAEERRRGEALKKPLRQGRVKTDEKWRQLTELVVELFPEDLSPKECDLGPRRVVWRIDNGQAKRVGSQLHRGPNGELPQGLTCFQRVSLM